MSQQRSFGERILGALRLDASVFEEVEHDEGAMGQAAGIVALASLAAGLGAVSSQAGSGAIGAAIGGLIGWVVSAAFIWFIGVRMMNHTSDYPELLRTLAFASAPQLFLVLGVIPILGGLVGLVVFFWGLAAYIVSVREALDVETGQAVFICIVAYGLKVATIFSLVLIGGILGGMAAALT